MAASCVCCLARLEPPSWRVLPCGHVYCLTCIGTRCKMGVQNRQLVPAHCCKMEFPIDYVKEVLTPADTAQYERFVQEKGWRNLDLNSDREYAQVVQQLQYKQCPVCGVGVEKISGCDWVKCLRGHGFCYRCGVATCDCSSTQAHRYDS